jgi:superfamily I DNA/RNA helicase
MFDEMSVSTRIQNAVRFTAIHSTKGIEFDTAFLVKCEDGFQSKGV